MAETLRNALLATASAPKAPPPSVEQKKRRRDRSARISPILDHLADDELLLTRAEAAGYLRKSVPTLERWAKVGIGPKPRRIGGSCLYSLGEVRGFAAQAA